MNKMQIKNKDKEIRKKHRKLSAQDCKASLLPSSDAAADPREAGRPKKTNLCIIRKELVLLAWSFIACFVFLKILYYKESLLNTTLIIFAIYYLFVIPGYVLLLSFRRSMNPAVRLVLGFGLGLGIESLLVYYLNIIFHIPISPYYKIYPGIIILAGTFITLKNRPLFHDDNKEHEK